MRTRELVGPLLVALALASACAGWVTPDRAPINQAP